MSNWLIIVSLIGGVLSLAYGVVSGERQESINVFFVFFAVGVVSVILKLIMAGRSNWVDGTGGPIKFAVIGVAIVMLGIFVDGSFYGGAILMVIGALIFSISVGVLVGLMRGNS